MARCKRCGASFDYDKRDGVCPRCCFYNRPPGREQTDDEWMKNYNIEDNSYELPRSVVEQEQDYNANGRASHKRTTAKQKQKISGYKVRQEREKSKKTSQYYDSKTERRKRDVQEEKDGTSVVKKIIMILLVFVVLVTVAAGVLYGLRTSDVSGEEENYDIQIKMASDQAAYDGITAGDITYQVGEVKVLFAPGELQDLPEGEKCIGIWIEDDESGVNYDGINWERPYVYDGYNYREMLYVAGLDDAAKFDGMEIMGKYLSYYDQAGYAVYFVDADTTSVTLSLPCQSVDAGNSKKKSYEEVIDVVLPITE